jgi:spermidine synthase
MQPMNSLDSLDLIYALAASGAAMLLGVWFAKKQADAFQGESHNGYPAVTFSDYGDMRFLHLGSPAVQGSMRLSQPLEIHLEYVQRMMAWLLFVDLDQVGNLKAMQLGLGAASLTKFCHARLGMHTTAVEWNPQVIDTCRTSFHLPPNSARLNVVQGDAADIAQHSEWQGQIDVLHVDLYDGDAQCPVLDTEAFYRDCRQLLTATGCMVVNVFGQTSNATESIQKIMAVFGTQAVWSFKPTTAGNVIVLAFCAPLHEDKRDLTSQAQAIEKRWSLNTAAWLNALAPARLPLRHWQNQSLLKKVTL